MAAINRISRRLADPNADSVGSRLRQGRWRMLLERFPDFGSMRVLDLGGTVEHWNLAPQMPAAVVVLNRYPQESHHEQVTTVVGDACELPDELRGERFDLVYSNSVLEHVGGHARRVDMAAVSAAVSDHHWVQTPNRYFPVEPHWLFPFFQFLPASARAWASARWPFGWNRASGREALGNVLETELIGEAELHYLYPDSDIVKERVLGLSKSLIAVR